MMILLQVGKGYFISIEKTNYEKLLKNQMIRNLIKTMSP